MFKKNKEILVLDLGNSSVKVLIGKYDNNKIIIYDCFHIAIPPGIYENGKIMNMYKLKDQLEIAFREKNIDVKPTICTIESSFIITREMELPLVEKKYLREMLGYELEQYFPIELDKYVLQYKVVDEFFDKGIKKFRILAALIPFEIVSSCYDLIKNLNLSPLALDIHSNAICKLFNSEFEVNELKSLSEETIAVIDFGYSSTNIIIIENGIYKFNKIIDFGSRNIYEIIKEQLNISYEDMNKYDNLIRNVFCLDTKIIGPANYDHIGGTESKPINPQRNCELIRSNLEILLEKINHVFNYYRSRHPNNIINIIFLYGGIAKSDKIEKYMSNAFNIETYTIDNISKIQYMDPMLKEHMSMYINGIASLIRK